MKQKHIARALVLVLLLAFAINICYNALSWKDTTGGYLSSFSQLYHTPENTIDVVFVGTSHVYCGIYPSVLWRDHGIASFDMAVSGQDRQSAYYALKELLKTQRPKMVMVDLFALTYTQQNNIANEYRNLMGMKYSCNMLKSVSDYDMNPSVRRMDYYLRFPIIHSRYRELTRYDFEEYLPSLYGKGEDIYFENRDGFQGTENPPLSEAVNAKYDNCEYDWLKKIKLLSEECGFDLAFMLVPTSLSTAEQGRIKTAVDWATKNGIPFYNFDEQREEIGITEGKYYLDYGHLNAYGAEKLSEYIYLNVIETKGLKSHLGEKNYESWDDNLIRFIHEQNKKNLEDVVEAEDYTAIASKEDSLTVFVEIEGDVSDKNYDKALGNLGIRPDEWRQGGLWVYCNGEARKITPDEFPQGMVLQLGRFDYARVASQPLALNEKIMINDHSVSGEKDGLHLVIYDEFLEEEYPERDF